ncbi:MAG TPA: hypothetical protein VN200_05480 [Rhodoglobus sp.]|nr:hypothetical protein [Rhodoglobus sp.]
MSNLATARPLSAPSIAPAPRPRPHIEIAPTREQRRARPKVAYAIITIASVLAIFGGQLMLSIVVSDGAYQLERLEVARKDLLREQRALQEKLAIASSDQNLATQAAGLGMVPNSTQFAIDLSSGAVFQLPGIADPMGCGGTCNLVTNALATGVPPVTNAPPAQQTQQQASTPQAPPGVVDTLPAPVTH